MTGQPFFRWDWVGRNLDGLLARTVEHLQLTGLAVGSGLVVAVLLALIARRWRRTYGLLTGLTGLLYTIPSLAAFALLVPLFGFSTTTAVIALASYTLLILLRNTVAGLDAVPAEVREAADGMGYTPLRRFVEVELPLALPVIIAGLRIATVTVVGLVTVTALLGRGGLGFYILDGIRRSIPFPTGIIVGTVLAVVLAALLDLLLLLTERALTPWTRRHAA
jgi:osmoprotectant transport system permease protein